MNGGGGPIGYIRCVNMELSAINHVNKLFTASRRAPI